MSRWPGPRLTGLAGERTGLSWVRTTLACTAVALVVTRQLLHQPGPAFWVLGLGAAAIGLAALLGTIRGPRGPVGSSAALVACAITATAIVWVTGLLLG